MTSDSLILVCFVWICRLFYVEIEYTVSAEIVIITLVHCEKDRKPIDKVAGHELNVH